MAVIVDDIKLEAFNAASHLPLLDAWLHKPHVRRWWGIPEVSLAGALERPPRSGQAIITLAGQPVGYMCWQPIQDEDRQEIDWEAMPEAAFDMDILLGEAEHLGRGIGPKAILLLLRNLPDNPAVDLLGLSTATANVSAIRAYEKAGFLPVKEYESAQWGRCLFMAVRPHEAAA